MEVVNFKPGIRDKAKKLAVGFWSWLLRRFHNHHWEYESTHKILTPDQIFIGRGYIQKCSFPGCGKRRLWKSYE